MEVINHIDDMDESTDENVINDETVDVVLENFEMVDYEADVEVDSDTQYRLYTIHRDDNSVAYEIVQVSDDHEDNNDSLATPVNNAVQVLTSPVKGQFYVLSDNSEVATSESVKAATPRVTKLQMQRSSNIIINKRDERRRATHNEVERRRRDKINNWISKLGELLPDRDQDANGEDNIKTNSESQSKGSILARACEYIVELRETREKLVQALNQNAILTEEFKNLKQTVEELKNSNLQLTNVLSKSIYIIDI